MRQVRAVIAVTLAVTLSACAAHHAPPPNMTATPSDWTAIRAIRKGTPIEVTVDGSCICAGLAERASDTALTMTSRNRPRTIPRAAVARVEKWEMVSVKRDPWYVDIPIVSGVLGGLAGIVVGAIEKDKKVAGRSALVFFGTAYAGALYGMTHPPAGTLEKRLVYVRP